MQTVFIAVRLDFIGCFNGLIFCSVLVSDDKIKKINVTAWRIFSIRSSVELSRPVVVHCHLPICPIWACPWAKNLSNLPQIGSRLCGTHISETAGWIYLFYGMAEPSCAASGSFDLDFQGKILKMLYLRNGRADWHGAKGMWVDRMLDQHFDFELWPHPWPWPLIFKVKFWKSCDSGVGCPIDMERKGCESTECWTHVVTFNFDHTHDPDLEFSGSNFEIAVSQKWDRQSTWNEKDMSW